MNNWVKHRHNKFISRFTECVDNRHKWWFFSILSLECSPQVNIVVEHVYPETERHSIECNQLSQRMITTFFNDRSSYGGNCGKQIASSCPHSSWGSCSDFGDMWSHSDICWSFQWVLCLSSECFHSSKMESTGESDGGLEFEEISARLVKKSFGIYRLPEVVYLWNWSPSCGVFRMVAITLDAFMQIKLMRFNG